MPSFFSMHDFENEVVDCRLLQMEFEFSKATQDQTNLLVKFCAQKTMALLEEFFWIGL